ncbi:prephenate dehydrogenase [Halobacteriales archaeon QS_5_70_17]|jgi:prephenate dehydrogenase|nr:MAG: prephenate dehydrogenase [Halobacteriales archaeon QS_5_70_17]
MDVLVVGAGEMGTWFGGAVDAAPAYADPDAAAAERAVAATGGRVVPPDTDERFDAVCLAVPIPAVAEAVAEHAPRAERALVDVTGVMRPAVAAMREHAPDRERLSLHPLFAADAAPGTVAVVPDAPGPVTGRIRERLAERGNDAFETTPEEHDRAMATVQARAHAAVLAFGLAREEVPEEFHTPVSQALTDLLERATGGTPRVYADIQAAFGGAEDVADAASRLAAADAEAFEDLYRAAGPDGDREGGTGDPGDER